MASRSFYHFLVIDQTRVDYHDWDHENPEVLENCDLQILIVKVGPGGLKGQLVKQEF